MSESVIIPHTEAGYYSNTVKMSLWDIIGSSGQLCVLFPVMFSSRTCRLSCFIIKCAADLLMT